ncbi:MAG: EVE domain-containing protein [Acidobacteriota bacterium]
MPGLWLFKTEPSEYSFEQLRKEGGAVWDGVTNALALKHLRQVRRGDPILIYHTGSEKAAVGMALAASDAYAAPGDPTGKLVVVNLQPASRLPRPVALAEIKARRDMADFALVRMSRLSVMPVSTDRWKKILKMSRSAAPSAARLRAATGGARPAAGNEPRSRSCRGTGSPQGGARRR